MNLILPKNASLRLIKKSKELLDKFTSGNVRIRKTEKYGYRTVAIGSCERAVLIGNRVHVFSKHSDYERFINSNHLKGK